MEFDSLSGYSNITAYKPPEPKTVESRSQSGAETSAAQESIVADKSIDKMVNPTVNQTGNQEKNNEYGDNYEELAKRIKDQNDQSSVHDMIEKAVEQANKNLVGTNREFSFSVHEKTNRVMIKVIDSATKETVREIPPQKTLDALAKMWEMAGILVDEKR